MSRLSPKSIANYFLDLAQASGHAIDPMKLQKLVYYAQGWFAGYTGQELINEAVEAWPYGPVIPSLYHEFKRFGSQPIQGRATEYAPAAGDFVEVPRPLDDRLRGFLDNVWRNYGQYTGLKLSELTHAPDGPWDIARRRTHGTRSADIPFELIRDHFAEAVKNAQSGVRP
jgi:uncharacterized phage-associated protein